MPHVLVLAALAGLAPAAPAASVALMMCAGNSVLHHAAALRCHEPAAGHSASHCLLACRWVWPQPSRDRRRAAPALVRSGARHFLEAGLAAWRTAF